MKAAKSGVIAGVLALTVALFTVTGVFATDYYGNNTWAAYRLPWQHGSWHNMSQGYMEGNHGDHWSGEYFSLDFPMDNGTPVLAITQSDGCWIDDKQGSTGLGLYVVATAPGHIGSGTDYYFYGHLSDTWVRQCGDPLGISPVYEGQIGAWSGHSGPSGTVYHLHITVQNPGSTCFCGSTLSVKFPPLSGIDFDGKTGNYSDRYFSDSIMAGDNGAVPQPNHTDQIFDAWMYNGGVYGIGVPWNASGDPGVHGWANGVVQDFASGGGTAIILFENGATYAHGVYGAILQRYLQEGWLGYPTSGEYNDPLNSSWRRTDFENGFICWNGTTWAVHWSDRWWC
jgi:hypothetical protein